MSVVASTTYRDDARVCEIDLANGQRFRMLKNQVPNKRLVVRADGGRNVEPR
jgi:hypothetical protein